MVRSFHDHFLSQSGGENHQQSLEEQRMNVEVERGEEHGIQQNLGTGCGENDGMSTDEAEDIEMDSNLEESDGEIEETEMKQMLREVPTDVLTFVASSFLARLSNKDFERLLISFDDDFANSAMKLWTYNRGMLSKYYFCNTCGKTLSSSSKCSSCEKSSVAKFVRVGGHSQITEIVERYALEILKIRQELKNGKNLHHNLNSPFFSNLWRMENEECLHLSTIISIDGVEVPGNSKKIWPISLALVDLPTSDMQRSTNIIMAGIVECSESPTTAIWNAIAPMVIDDIESHTGQVAGIKFRCHVTSCSADQPAKRAFFGVKGHQSSLSCFFCLSPDTWYKLSGPSRQEERPGEDTIQDSEEGTNGFGAVPSKAVQYILPYETPVDILHCLGEGLFDKIAKEVNASNLLDCKSDLFFGLGRNLNEVMGRIVLPSAYKAIHNCRNGTDKCSCFRILTFLSALESDNIGPNAQIVLVSLGLVGNSMYTNSFGTDLLDEQCCSAARWFLAQASNQYFSIKAHEVLFHLAEANRKFGNCAVLSTFCFESFYQFSLLGYSTRMTRYFSENVCSKFLLHTSIRREIADRYARDPTPKLQKWVSKTTGLVSARTEWKEKIGELKTADKNHAPCESRYFSRIMLGVGTLSSEYFDQETCDDLFFASNDSGEKGCYRFVAAVEYHGKVRILAEPLKELDVDEQFATMAHNISILTDTDAYYGQELLRIIRSYDGISHCQPSGQRELLSIDSVHGIAAYLSTTKGIIVVQLNGAFVHN